MFKPGFSTFDWHKFIFNLSANSAQRDWNTLIPTVDTSILGTFSESRKLSLNGENSTSLHLLQIITTKSGQ